MSTQRLSMTDIYKQDADNSRVCEGIFRVYLKGIFLIWEKGTVRISVKGIVNVVRDQNNVAIGTEYRNLDFHILEATDDLKK